ncbi:glycoside hydrolase family 3 [Lotmaria passim]
MDLEMPSTNGATSKRLMDLAKAGKLNMKELDACVRRILEFVDRAAETLSQPAPKWDVDAHHDIAREVAAEGIVLLKNEQAVLPLHASKKIAVIGELAEKPRYQGSGSSFVNATKTSSTLAELKKHSSSVHFAAGYKLEATERDEALQAKAVEVAASCDVAVVFIGLSEVDESEGFDRAHMRLPEHHNALVEAVAAANKHTVVVLTNASAVEMPWAHKVQAIVEAYLPGQAGAAAVADVLLGKVNPSGKLSETFPLSVKHNPSYLNFPGKYDVTYCERIYVGYRYYDTVEMPVLFPFGHGLSYTTFEYSAPRVAKAAYVDNEDVHAEVTVTNTGKVAGSEVVQLYVRDVKSSIDRPEKELKGFEKVHLAPGESKTVKFTLDRRAFAYYDVARKDWVVEEGDFELLFASSSRDVRADVLLGKVNPSGKLSESFPKYLKHTPAYLNFPGKYDVTYCERIYVGYRYYDTVEMPVLFPFGHGLSYTTFEYSAPRVAKAAYVDNEDVHAEVTVTNTGKVAGSEVVQLYVRDVKSSIDRPEKELKGFEKVHLAPGESKTVKFTLDRRAFAYYDVARKDWVVEEGDFELLFASSSRDVRGSAHVKVSPATPEPPRHFNKNSMIGDVCFYPPTACMTKKLRRDFTGSPMQPSFILMFQEMELMLPIRSKVALSDGSFTFDDVEALVEEANRLSNSK